MGFSRISGGMLGLFAIVLAFASTVYFVAGVQAQQGDVVLSVDPLLAQGPSGGQATVNLNIDNAELAAGIQFDLEFDATVVSIANVDLMAPGDWSAPVPCSEGGGSGPLECALIGLPPPGLPSFTMAEVTFDLIGPPGSATDLVLNNVLVGDASTPTPLPLPTATTNGRIEIDSPPTTVTVVKEVINDNGGAAVVSDFDLFIDGNPVTSGVAEEVAAGAHVVSESGHGGYTATFSGDCDAGGNVTLDLGESKTCTITNDDIAPTLTVIKQVINDNDGTSVVTDFTLLVDGNPVTSGVAEVVDAGAHVVSETGPGGYRATFSGACDANGNVSLALAEDGICTITNDDAPPGAQIFIDPDQQTAAIGQVFDVRINVDPQGETELSGVQAFVDFDPTKLQVRDVDGSSAGIQIQNGTVLVDFQSTNKANNSLGQIDYAAGNVAGGSPLPTGVFTLATIQFEALALTNGSPTPVTFATSPDTRNTKATDLTGRNITGARVGGSVEIIEAVTLRVNYRLQGGARPQPAGWEGPVTVELTDTATNATQTLTTNGTFDAINSQAFVEVPIVPVGLYDITLNGLSTLTNVKLGAPVGIGNDVVDMGILRAGNAEVVDTPNIIDIQDFGVLSGAFGSAEGDPQFDARADFDANKVINVSDFGLLVLNFLKTGPVIVP